MITSGVEFARLGGDFRLPPRRALDYQWRAEVRAAPVATPPPPPPPTLSLSMSTRAMRDDE